MSSDCEKTTLDVIFHSLDKDGIRFFKTVGYELVADGKTFGWTGTIDEEVFWSLIIAATNSNLAAMIYKKDDGKTIFRIDSNKWHFRQR